MSHGAGANISDGNRKIGLLIAVLALLLAFSEMGNKQSEAESLAKNIESSNLWAFFQAKTIRRTSTQIGIVLASAAVITGLTLLVWCAGGMSGVALVLMGFAIWAPMSLPLPH